MYHCPNKWPMSHNSSATVPCKHVRIRPSPGTPARARQREMRCEVVQYITVSVVRHGHHLWLYIPKNMACPSPMERMSNNKQFLLCEMKQSDNPAATPTDTCFPSKCRYGAPGKNANAPANNRSAMLMSEVKNGVCRHSGTMNGGCKALAKSCSHVKRGRGWFLWSFK